MSCISDYFDNNNRAEKWKFLYEEELDNMIDLIDEDYIKIEEEGLHKIDSYLHSVKKKDIKCDECSKVLPCCSLFELHICQHLSDELTEEQITMTKLLETCIIRLHSVKGLEKKDLMELKDFVSLNPIKKLQYIIERKMILDYISHYRKYYYDKMHEYNSYCFDLAIGECRGFKGCISSYTLSDLFDFNFDTLLINEESELFNRLKKFEDNLILKFDPENRKINAINRDFDTVQSYSKYISFGNDYLGILLTLELKIVQKEFIDNLVKYIVEEKFNDDIIKSKLDELLKHYKMSKDELTYKY